MKQNWAVLIRNHNYYLFHSVLLEYYHLLLEMKFLEFSY
jgi:hypothetical protein